jgi:hypothetical protein
VQTSIFLVFLGESVFQLLRLCLVPHFTQIFFEFWPIILHNRTKHHAKLWQKRYPFSILDFGLKRQKKSQKAPHPPHEKFGILDEIKHTHKNFSILYFIIPK